jgi:hypothetical protein
MDSMENPDMVGMDIPAARSHRVAVPGLSIHYFLPIFGFYIFLNHAGLPNGLFYSTLVSPFLYVWLYLQGRRWLTATFLLILAPFIMAHLVLGIASPTYYLRSMLLLWTAYITTYALGWALLRCRNIERLFDEIIVLHFVAGILAIACLHTPLQNLFWMDTSNTLADSSHLLRFSLLNSEPGVCAALMLPLVIYAAIRLIRDSKKRSFLYLMMIAFPLLLTQSFGGLGISVGAISVTLVTTYRQRLMRPRTLIIVACLALAAGALFVVHNPISQRVLQVVTGNDSSTQSRTTLAFVVAYLVASSKSLLWGVGLGQAKLVDLVSYGFENSIIPNAVAATFAELGIVGVLVRLTVELYLFFRTRVYRNPFRLAMFVASFFSQLTGGNLMNVQNYLLWCFAFLPFFPEMDQRVDSKPENP